MNYRAKTKQFGLTMIELLVALSISVIVVLFTSMVFSYGVKHVRLITGEAKLITQSAYIVDILSFHIRPAYKLESNSSDILTIINHDLTTKTFTFTGNNLQLDGVPILSSAVNPIQFSIFSFQVIDNSVQVNYEITTNVGNLADFNIHPIQATTTIATRN